MLEGGGRLMYHHLMKRTIITAVASSACAAAIAACVVDPGGPSEPVARYEDGLSAAGSVPAGLPAHVSVGLFEGKGDTWMKTSGVSWDMRYAYFTKGWV